MFLDDILLSTRESVATAKRREPSEEVKRRIRDIEPPRDFLRAITPMEGQGLRLVAEIKQASPSRGLLRKEFHPVIIGQLYEEEGASALSVLTEERFFMGSIKHIGQIHAAVNLPILRKDFLIDEYQIFEARAKQADAILLIVSILDHHQLKDFHEIAEGLGMGCLIEVHAEAELERALGVKPKIIGINNRDLKTFTTNLEVTFRLLEGISDQQTVIAESGISTLHDIQRLQAADVDAVLIGETFMISEDIRKKIRELFNES